MKRMISWTAAMGSAYSSAPSEKTTTSVLDMEVSDMGYPVNRQRLSDA